ncbi:MAG: hypothetical protein FJ386_08790 [Verrucomicrobia bacterium]|nr:hypothetical protein [Verrucomicrobiota bacterium]
MSIARTTSASRRAAPEEFAIVALPGARLVPLRDLPARVEELADWRHAESVVCCHHGIRSAHAIGWLRPLGFTRLHNLAGGIDRWSVGVGASAPWY